MRPLTVTTSGNPGPSPVPSPTLNTVPSLSFLSVVAGSEVLVGIVGEVIVVATEAAPEILTTTPFRTNAPRPSSQQLGP